MASTKVGETKFGSTSDTNQTVNMYTITNSRSAQLEVIDFGATIRCLRVPTKNGSMTDVILGFEKFEDYEKNRSPYLGSVVGRVCNRIKEGQFKVNDEVYKLAINNGPNHLHGGLKGFSHRLWTTKEIGTDHVIFEYVSVDGEEGYPSTVRVTTTYRLLANPNRLIIQFDGVNEGPKITPINLTNHAYFNLGGVDQSILNIGDHRLTVFSDTYLPTDNNGLVSGQVFPVDDTIFDLRSPAMLADCFDRLLPKLGYDNHFCNQSTDQPKKLAEVSCSQTGLKMSVSSTQPGLQIYTAQFMDVQGGKYGRSYGKHSGIALETQHYPDSVNNPNFPSIWLRPGEKYREVTIYEFSDE